MANYHISGDRSKGYNIKREGAIKISGHTNTKAEAESLAKQYSHNSGGGEVRIHGLNGQIIDSDTVKPGNDQRNIIDKVH